MIKKEFEVREEKTKTVTMKAKWVLRGISSTQSLKKVVAEKEHKYNPTYQEIAQFLYDNKEATFCVVEEVFCLDEAE